MQWWLRAVVLCVLSSSAGCYLSYEHAHEREPDVPLRDDAGRDEQPPTDIDAGQPASRPDAGTSAPLDAGTPVRPDAGEPEPPLVPAFPDLVFVANKAGDNGTYAVSTREPGRVHRLDPTPDAIDVGAKPIAYSPDGRALLVARRDPATAVYDYFVTFPCRDGACPSDRNDLVLSTPRANPEAVFAPDGSGLTLHFTPADSSELYYVALSADHAEPALPIGPPEGAILGGFFVANGDALIVEASEPRFVDLRSPPDGALEGVPLIATGADGLTPRTVRGSVAPDASHFVYTVYDIVVTDVVFETAELLVGQYAGRELPVGQRALHASQHRWLMQQGEHTWAERYDGSDPVDVAIGDAEVHGCGEHVAFGDLEVGTFVMPGAEPGVAPAIYALPGAHWSWQARFTPDCERMVLVTSSCSQSTAIDLGTRQVFSDEVLCFATLMPEGPYYQRGGGMEEIFELAAGPERVSAWRPRIGAGSTYAYANHRAAMFVAGPLEGPAVHGLYEIDLAVPGAPVQRRLVPETMAATIGALSPDDRYLAYNVARANIANPPEVETGLFEYDSMTSQRRKIGPATTTPLRGTIHITPIPATRAVMVIGQYEQDAVVRAYACSVGDDAGRCVEQLPESHRSWQVVPISSSGFSFSFWWTPPTLSSDGTQAAVNVAAPEGPGLAVFPIRLSTLEPAPAPTVLIDRDFMGSTVTVQRTRAVGFIGDLGLAYYETDTSNGLSDRSLNALFVLDGDGLSRDVDVPSSGYADPAADAIVAITVAGAQGRMLVTRMAHESGGDVTLRMIESSAPERSVTIAQSYNVHAQLLPGERHISIVSYAHDNACIIEVYELATGRRARIADLESSPDDPAADRLGCEVLPASADGNVLTVRSTLGNLLYLDFAAQLERAPDAPLVPVALPSSTYGYPSLSGDGRFVAWSAANEGFVFDAREKSVAQLRVPGERVVRAEVTVDGRYVLALSRTETEPVVYRFHRFDAGAPDRAPIALAPGLPTGDVRVDPSGQHVAFADPGRIYVVALDDPEHAVSVGDGVIDSSQVHWLSD